MATPVETIRAAVLGNPPDPLKQPDNELVVRAFEQLYADVSSLAAGLAVGEAVAYATRAALYADLLHDAGVLGIVYADGTPAFNGIYVKAGASGAGSWGITTLALPSTFTADLAAKAPINNPTFTGTVAGVTKTHVGLANVDNTSDVNKPVSVAQAAAIAVEAALRMAADIEVIGSVGGAVDAITGTVSGADASGRRYELVPTGNNTGPATLALNGGPALPILDAGNQALAAGELGVARRYILRNYGGASYRIINSTITLAERQADRVERQTGDNALQASINALSARTILGTGMLSGGGSLAASRTIDLPEATEEEMREATASNKGASARNVRPLVEELARPSDIGRPGATPWMFMNGTTGSVFGQTAYSADEAEETAGIGQFLQKTGAHIVAPIQPKYIIPGRRYRVTAFVARASMIPDPNDHAVQLRLRCLNGLYASLGSPINLQTVSDLGVGSRVMTGVVSTVAGAGITQLLAGTVMCRAFVEWFGGDGVNRTAYIIWDDITDSDGVDLDLDAVEARVTALEAIDAEARLVALETAAGGPVMSTFDTLAAAVSGDIPISVEAVEIHRRDSDAPIMPTYWARVGSAPTDGNTFFQNNDGSYFVLSSGRGIAYVLATGQSNMQQNYYAGSSESALSPFAKIWDTGLAAWVDIAPGYGGLNADNPNHSLYTTTRRMVEELGYFEVRVIYEAFGGRPVEQWAGAAAIPASAEIDLGAAVAHDSLAASFTKFNDGDTLTLHSALAGGGTSIRTLVISGTTTIRDVLTWLRLEANIRAGLDISGQKIILEADADYSISSNESGGGDFDTVDLDFTPADRTLDSGNRPMATLIVDKCTAAGVVRFDAVIWTQVEADTSVLTDPKFWPITDETTYLPQWLAWVKDFEERGLFTRDTKYIINGIVDGINAGPQAIGNRILRHIPLMHENVAVVSSAGLLGFDEGHVDAGGFSYRNHFSGETDTEELGHRDFAAFKALEEGGQPTNHNLYPYTEIMRPDGTPGVIGHYLIAPSNGAFIATERHFRGSSIRATGATTINLDDRKVHPVYLKDFGREIVIWSGSTGSVITIETSVHEIFDELGDILNTARYTLVRRGAGMIRLQYFVGQWRVVQDTFTKDWEVGGTITPSGTKVFTRDECMGRSYVLNAGDYELPAADVSMARMRIKLRTAGEITLDTTAGGIYSGSGAFTAAGVKLVIPINQTVILEGSTTQRWTIIGGTWKPELKHVVAKTANYSLTRNDTGKVHTNAGAAGAVNFSLFPSEAGLLQTFVVTVAQPLRITAAAGDRIGNGAAFSATGGYIESSTVGDAITLLSMDGVYWRTIAIVGAGWSAPT